MKEKKGKIIIGAVLPSYAIGSNYRIILAKMINAMVQDYKDIIADNFEVNKPILEDATPKTLNDYLTQANERWKSFFGLRSEKYSKDFVKDVSEDVQRQLRRKFIKAKVEALAVGLSKENEVALKSEQALIEFNINLIKSIPSQYFDKIQGLVNNAISNSKGKTWLAGKIQSVGQVTKARAMFISRDQLRKATSAIDNARRLGMGIKKAIWRHSRGDKEPRKSHLAAAGREYFIAKGCYIDGEYIQVGEKINCTCYSESVIDLE